MNPIWKGTVGTVKAPTTWGDHIYAWPTHIDSMVDDIKRDFYYEISCEDFVIYNARGLYLTECFHFPLTLRVYK